MCGADGNGGYTCMVATSLYHLTPGANGTDTGDCGIPDYMSTRTSTDPYHGGDWCGAFVTPQFSPSDYSVDNEDICNGMYIDLNNADGPEYVAKCIYTEVSTDMYKCIIEEPYNYPCM